MINNKEIRKIKIDLVEIVSSDIFIDIINKVSKGDKNQIANPYYINKPNITVSGKKSENMC